MNHKTSVAALQLNGEALHSSTAKLWPIKIKNCCKRFVTVGVKQTGIVYCMYSQDKCWYLVQCKPRESFRAELHLKNQHYECFHPTYSVKRKFKSSVRSVIQPLFPHYLFVLLNQQDNWSAIRSTRGVNSVVTFNGIPASLDQKVITALKFRCMQMQSIGSEPLFKAGDRVLITEGCFRQIEAIVTAVTGEERVSLLFNLFNREQHVELPVTVLDKAS
ncbi:MAG: transcription/translation regulatory transformer protein RfaH [Gammaproteobacteria bacterium]|nr:transcription/translation regulatory transformer protein RfaH [Gammaproteobacteria bacterium]